MLTLAAAVFAAPATAADRPAPPDWDEVWPILERRCVNCHSAHGAPKGVRLDSYEAVLAGGTDRPVVVAGDAGGSELVRRILGQSTPRMPFLAPPLPESEAETLIRWIDAGLPPGTGGG